jgi:hypothetical protein
MGSTAAFGRLKQFHLEPEPSVRHAAQRPDAARPPFEKRTEPARAAPTEVSFGPFRLLRTQSLLLEGDKPVLLGSRALEILIALLGFAALRRKHGVQLDLVHVPVSEDARTSRPCEISFLAAPTVIETSPSLATAAANRTSLEVTTKRSFSDAATQGSSV